MTPRAFPLLFIACFALVSCQRDSIETYTVPKEIPPVSGTAKAPAPTPVKQVEWQTPKGWKELPPSSFRVGSFLIGGENGQQADMSVIPLTGEAGGELANINRWRGQIDLPPLTEADLSAQSEMIKPGQHKMLYINFAKGKKRLMAAIYHRKDQTWFFKILGDDATVLAAKPALMRFLRSLKFNDET